MRLSQRYRAIGSALSGSVRVAVVAQDRVAGGTVVLKMAAEDTPLAEDLAQEAAILADLSHPHLVELVDVFDARGGLDGAQRVSGFATRWVDGLPLVAAVADAPLAERMSAFGQLLDAAGYLHRRGVLHLDLKPDNALFGPEGVCLLDLGSARGLDAGPGEAGGTLGYAAPEVLAGQAASVATDVFSLGAILYELLAGRSAYGDLDAAELRRAALAGEFVPVRAVAPRTPPALARLAEDMMRLAPAERPDGIGGVVRRLEEAGYPVPLHAGVPPLIGRGAQIERLLAAMAEPAGQRIAIVGAEGAGRTRLARAALRRAADAVGRDGYDLTLSRDPLRYLDGLACASGRDVPARNTGAPWIRGVAGGIEAWAGPPGVVLLGRRADIPPDTLRDWEALVPSLIAGGFVVLEVSEEEVPGALPVVLPALDPQQTASLGRFYGVNSSAQLREIHARTGGNPGALVQLLAPRPRGGAGRAGAAAQLLALLERLPAGIPDRVLAVLPAEPSQLQLLADRGLIRRAADGRTYVESAAAAPVDPDVAEGAAAVVRMLPIGEDAAWLALALARLGDLPSARERFAAVPLAPGTRRSILLELVEILSDAGDRRAAVLLAGLREEDGDLQAAAHLLLALDRREPEEERQLIRVLRRGGRLDEAEDRAQLQLERAPGADLWLELAEIRIARGDLAGGAEACVRAQELSGEAQAVSVLAVRVRIAVRRLRKGDVPDDLDGLLEAVQERHEVLSSATLSSAGRILIHTGALVRGEQMLAQAAKRADAEGDVRRSAGIRLNQGNALHNLGRGRDARITYREALAIAEGTGDAELILRIRYSLADLELRSGRVPAAETQVRAFRAEAARAQNPEVLARAGELRGRLLLARGRPEEALECATGMKTDGLPLTLRTARDMIIARALLELGRAEDILPALADTPRSLIPTVNAYVDALRGRAHLAIARRHLASARAAVPDEPDPSVRLESGQVLLATAGEDLDPESFGGRRGDLDRAARLLRGAEAATAATLRDRFLEGPGANLEGIVQLTEAMHDPQAFPEALAQLVGQALGAYRVLIMVAIPGLGRQMTYTELSGSEAAGIGKEVLRRIQAPEDHWLAHNAFADPHLRRTSQTVRTFELKSLLAVAIPQGDKAVGALYVDDLHRTNRFSDEDVAILKRLARGVGRMLPMLATSRQGVLPEPRDVLGVLLTDASHVQRLEDTVAMATGRDQLNLLISGPTGAGKSVLARRVARDVLELDGIESIVLRKGDPQFLVTQLFGSRRGEFTDAQDREGAIQRCLRNGRALFLDEVQNLDEVGQQILLPLLELPERRFGGLTGSAAPIDGPLHVILGTNAAVAKGEWAAHFREDLWYRMSAVHYDLPPLLARGPEAIYRYLRGMLASVGAPSPEEVFGTSALYRVTGWHWPGNLRQLQRFAERAGHLHRTTGRRIGPEQLARLGLEDDEVEVEVEAEGLDRAMVERVWQALRRSGFVQSKAAQELRMTPSRLNKFLDRHDLRAEVARQRREARMRRAIDRQP